MQILPGTAAWHAARARNVGASEVAALYGVQPDYAPSHFALWQIKAGRIPAPDVRGDRPAWGLRLEDAIAQAAADQEGWQVERAGFVPHPTVRGMSATLDFLIVGGAPERGILECKNADWLQHRRTWTGGEPPLHIVLQLQQQLACAGLSWGAVACLVGGNQLEVYRYERRPKIIADIEKRVAAFWRSIEQDRPPPIDGEDSTAAALKAMFPEGSGDELADLSASNELPELCAAYLKGKERMKEIEKGVTEAENRIRALVGANRGALCEGFVARLIDVKETPPTEITPEMVGTLIGGRKGYRRLAVKERGVGDARPAKKPKKFQMMEEYVP